ncbi:uncharacterized protein LOC144545351 [Carex rostrata]
MTKLLILSLVLLASSLVSSTVYIDVSYCNNNADYAVKVNGLGINPFPVKPGRETTFTISASTAENITNGKLLMDVEILGIHIQQTIDLCKETSCPATGNFVLVHKESLPILSPPGTYKNVMTMVGEDGKKLTCITFDFHIYFSLIAKDIQSSALY